MNEPRSQRYIPGQRYYLPESVFFSNLLECCQCDSNIVFERITTTMQADIDICVNRILNIINYIERTFPETKASEPKHLLPNDFIKFVKQNGEGSTEKGKAYLLLRCYQRIHSTLSWVENLSENVDTRPQCLDEDKFILYSFQGQAKKLDAVSHRESFRIKSATGVPVKEKSARINTYSKNQNEIIRFTIEKVLPDMIIRSENNLLSYFTSNSWHDVVCKSTLISGIKRGVIIIDSNNSDDLVKFIQSRFNYFRAISTHQNLYDEIQQFGKNLLEVYDKLSVCHKNGAICGFEADYDPRTHSDFADHQVCTPMDDAEYERDAYISDHIIKLLEWLHFTYENTPSFMDSIDRVIDRIRPQVMEQLGVAFSLDEFRKFEKEGCSGSSLFVWPGCELLLALVLDAIHYEPIVFMKKMIVGGRHEQYRNFWSDPKWKDHPFGIFSYCYASSSATKR